MSKQLDQPHLLVANLPPHRPSLPLPSTPPATENRHACLAWEQVLLHRKGKEGSRGRGEGRDAAPSEMHDEPESKSRHERETETEAETERQEGKHTQRQREIDTQRNRDRKIQNWGDL